MTRRQAAEAAVIAAVLTTAGLTLLLAVAAFITWATS